MKRLKTQYLPCPKKSVMGFTGYGTEPQAKDSHAGTSEVGGYKGPLGYYICYYPGPVGTG